MGRAWIVLCVLTCACGGSKKATPTEPAPLENKQVEPTAPPPQPETPTMAFERYAREMCACAPGDADCAKRVSDGMTAWSQKVGSESKDPVKLTEEEQRRLTEIGTRFGECMQRAMSAPP